MLRRTAVLAMGAVLVFFCGARSARANSCLSGSLASLEGTTCTIGDVQFSFGIATITNVNNGATPLSLASITFTPNSGNPFHPGFSLMGNIEAFSANSMLGGASVDLFFPMTITPLNSTTVTGFDGTLTSYNLMGGATNSVVEMDSDQCFVTVGCTGFTAGVEVGQNPFSMPSNSITLAVPSPVGSTSGDFELSAFTGDGQGLAQILSADFNYSVTPTPEPASLLLLGSGLLGLAQVIRRKRARRPSAR
jgi:hypothetical protein